MKLLLMLQDIIMHSYRMLVCINNKDQCRLPGKDSLLLINLHFSNQIDWKAFILFIYFFFTFKHFVHEPRVYLFLPVGVFFNDDILALWLRNISATNQKQTRE